MNTSNDEMEPADLQIDVKLKLAVTRLCGHKEVSRRAASAPSQPSSLLRSLSSDTLSVGA